MAILRNHDISDDEFDMLEPEPVSDLSTPDPDSHGSHNFTPLSPRRAPIRYRPGFPVRVPVPRLRPRSEGPGTRKATLPPPASHDATGSDDQRTYASTFGTNKPTNNEAGRTSEGIPGLKYTKSVYQKLWGGKDALIAVMG
ncbi:hypothetical protein PG999_014042 [Apiospora kogelbergensis]|uniref:Uncharacterized protein n=1 Tax=Apiospora kogelbergensis TaxID=1337665 RepID=A0AAW0QG49_9PEZI